MTKRKITLVLCAHCAYRIGPNRLTRLPICVQEVKFVPGVLREVIDIQGVSLCVIKNKRNNCKHFTSFKFSAIMRRRLVISFLKGSSDEKFGRDYNTEQEKEQVYKARKQYQANDTDQRGKLKVIRGGSKADRSEDDNAGEFSADDSLVEEPGRDLELFRRTTDSSIDSAEFRRRRPTGGRVNASDRERGSFEGTSTPAEGTDKPASENNERGDGTITEGDRFNSRDDGDSEAEASSLSEESSAEDSEEER